MARRKKKIRIVNGRSYQVNKKWSELSQVQKRWILADAKYHYDKLTADTSQPITNVVSSRIRKWNRRMTARQSAGLYSTTDSSTKSTIE